MPKPLLPRSAALGFDPEVPVANQLSRRSFWIAFAIVLGLFLFLGGPVWRDPFNIDRQIIGSYLPIPILVAALLAVEKKLRAMPWFLATMELTALKFAVTNGQWLPSIPDANRICKWETYTDGAGKKLRRPAIIRGEQERSGVCSQTTKRI